MTRFCTYGGTWSYQGVEAWCSMVVDWFGSLGSERVMVAVEDVQVMTEHGIALVHALVTYQGVSAEGEALRAMQNRFTWVLHNRAGLWKIIHEHSSAPVDFETSNVMLQR